MKKVTRFFSLLLAIAMVLAMNFGTLTVSAASGSYTLTIDGTVDGHTYSAYQIFAGDVSGTAGSYVLSNIKFGDGVNTSNPDEVTLISAIAAAANLGGSYSDAAALAEALKDASSSDIEAVAKVLKSTYLGSVSNSATDDDDKGDSVTIESLAAGYYLVVDASSNTSGTEGDVYSSYIVVVVGNTTANTKLAVPTVEKKVDDKNDSTTDEDTEIWWDSADYDIGDSIPFKLTATVATNYAAYDDYVLTFHDEQSDGLTFGNITKVEVDGQELQATEYTLVTGTGNTNDGCDFEVAVVLKGTGAITSTTASAGSTVTVYYTSKLNEDAVIGSKGNPNEVYLEYSNNPYDSNDTGKTPKDKVTVFTFELLINKTDSTGNALKGAGFTLYKYDASKSEYVAVGSEKSGATSFAFTGLDAGYYMIKETTTPSGYNTIDDIYFTVASEHETTSDNPQLDNENGLTVTQTNSNWEALAEADITAKFTVTKDGTGATITTDDGTSTVSGSANITTSVKNYSGAELPSTGGMGTKIFYTLGGVLVLGAGVLLIVKRRMRNA